MNNHNSEELLNEEEIEQLYRQALKHRKMGDLRKATELLVKADIHGCEKTKDLFRFEYNDYHKNLKLSQEDFMILEIASEMGYDQALFSLGARYRSGYGVKKDRERSIGYFQKAADRNNKLACNHLGDIYYKGKFVEKDLDKAFEYYSRASSFGYPPAQYMVGVMYENGDPVEYNPELAMKYFRMSAEGGYDVAVNHLGIVYEKGEIVDKDLKTAFDYYTESADMGYGGGYFGIFRFYFYGIYVEKDMEKALEYAKKVPQKMSIIKNNIDNKEDFENLLGALEDHDIIRPVDQFYAGQFYEEGKYVDKDIKKAIHYYKESASNGNSFAEFHLGEMYEKGIIVEKDIDKAIKHYNLAGKKGYMPAFAKVRELRSQINN